MRNERKLFLVADAILGVAWLVCMLLLCNLKHLGGICLTGLAFGTITFVLAGAMNLIPENGHALNDASAHAIPIVVSATYLFVSILINTAAALTASLITSTAPLAAFFKLPLAATLLAVINIVLLAVYALYSLYSLAYLNGLYKKTNELQERSANTANLSAMLGNMLALTGDAALKADILKLKEAVNYSTTTTAAAGSNAEAAVMDEVSRAQAALTGGASADEVKQHIERALQIWHARNASITR